MTKYQVLNAQKREMFLKIPDENKLLKVNINYNKMFGMIKKLAEYEDTRNDMLKYLEKVKGGENEKEVRTELDSCLWRYKQQAIKIKNYWNDNIG